MTKHYRIAGKSFRTISIGGKQYTLRPAVLGVYAEMEAYVVSLRQDPLEIATRACQRAPANQHAAIWDAAMRAERSARIATAEEMASFENSVPGIAWKLWKSLEQDHPEIDGVAAALALLEQAGEDRLSEIVATLHVATGEGDIKNCSGREEEPTTETSPPTPLPAGQ